MRGVRGGVEDSEEGERVRTGEGGERVGVCEREGEGYIEPSYITRQRCLVLNDWALELFGIGEYRKVRWCLTLLLPRRRGSLACVFFFWQDWSYVVIMFLGGYCCRGGPAGGRRVSVLSRSLSPRVCGISFVAI